MYGGQQSPSNLLDPSNYGAEFYMNILWTPPKCFSSCAYLMLLTLLAGKVRKKIIPLTYAGQCDLQSILYGLEGIHWILIYEFFIFILLQNPSW